jgi:hypothetical protein
MLNVQTQAAANAVQIVEKLLLVARSISILLVADGSEAWGLSGELGRSFLTSLRVSG